MTQCIPTCTPVRPVACPGSASLKRPRPPEKESIPQSQGDDGHEGIGKTCALASAPSGAPSRATDIPREQHEQRQVRDSVGGGNDALSLPWMADRFYLNLLPSTRHLQEKTDGWRDSRDRDVRGGSGGGGGDRGKRREGNGSGDHNNLGNGNVDGGGGDLDGSGQGYANGPFFSLERLVEVVCGEGWPGIKAAVFGTFSLEMGRLAKEVPRLFSRSNRAIPVLVLHGDSLRRDDSARGRRRAEFIERQRQRRRRWGGTGMEADGEAEGVDAPESKAGEGGEECGKGGDQAEMKGRGQAGEEEDYFLWRKGVEGRVSRELLETMEAAGSLDRLFGWGMRMPGRVQVEKVRTGRYGVHHPKFGLLFLNDGSLVVYVGTGNLGVDTAIDATWVQRFGPRGNREADSEAGAAGAAETGARARARAGTGDAEPPVPESPRVRETRGVDSDDDDDDDDDGATTWTGDFGSVLQDFIEEESWLMIQDTGNSLSEARRKRRNNPVEFLRRELGIWQLEDSFDFATAAVDLVPTVPTPGNAALARLRPWQRRHWQQQQQQQRQHQPEAASARKRCSPERFPLTPVAPPPPPPPEPSGRDGRRTDVGSRSGDGGTPIASSSERCWQQNAYPTVTSPPSSSTCPHRPLPAPPSQDENAATARSAGGVRAAGGCRNGSKDIGTGSSRDGEGGADGVHGDRVGGGGGGGGSDDAHASTGEAACESALPFYGQLRMKHVLGKRRQQVGEAGPGDSLILQPTSIGAGIDEGFLEVFAKNLMPDSVEPLQGDLWREREGEDRASRLDSVRIVWPSMQYIDACREDMRKSGFSRDRQASTTMGVDISYVAGQSCKASRWESNGFVFMSPDHFDAMGPDLHACLTTFQLHPATALALPPRPAHIKSAMRLRKAPPLESELPPIPRAQRRRWHSGDLRLGGTKFQWDKERNKGPLHGAAGAAAAYAAVAPLEGSVEAGEGAVDDDDDGPVCENAQHFAWFLLTSACLSKGAQGEVMHRDGTGAPCGVTFKNVELGVLFHSSPDRAYHAAPLPDCSCFSCRRRRRRQGGRGRPHAASSARTRVGEVAAPPGHPRKARTPRPIPLPVPFCTDSEAYADPGGQSPHVRFPPHMHTLQDARPWSAEVHNLLQSEVKEAQFA